MATLGMVGMVDMLMGILAAMVDMLMGILSAMVGMEGANVMAAKWIPDPDSGTVKPPWAALKPRRSGNKFLHLEPPSIPIPALKNPCLEDFEFLWFQIHHFQFQRSYLASWGAVSLLGTLVDLIKETIQIR